MVNKKGGKKHKKGKKNNFQTRELRFKEIGQEYAQIKRCNGNCRFDVFCFDGKERMATLCGTMRKRKFVNLNNIVLVSLRDFEDAKCDIIDLYDDNQVYQLKDYGELPKNINLSDENDFNNFNEDEDYFTMDIPEEDENIENKEENKEEDDIDFDFDEI